MRLYFAAPSPFVRKVVVTAAELGLQDRIERVDGMTTPIDASPTVTAANPLGKIPTLETDDGEMLFDSRVICEYLAASAGDEAMLPKEGAARWRVLRMQALADGILDASVLRRYEAAMRPEDKQWAGWTDGQKGKADRALDALEAEADSLGEAPDLGTIAVGCALGYLDFRFAEEDWRGGHPRLAAWYEKFSQRPSMTASVPPSS